MELILTVNWSFPFSLLEKETGKLSQSIYSVTYFVEFVSLLRFIRLSPPVNAAVLALVCRGYQPASPIIQYTTVEMPPGSLWFHGLLKLWSGCKLQQNHDFHLDFVGEALEFLFLCRLIKRAPAGLLKLFKGFILTSVCYVMSLAP